MKRILLVTTDFYPRIGGVATYYTKLCEGLSPQDIIVLSVGEGAVSASSPFPYQVITKKWARVVPQWLQSVWLIWRTVRQYRTETVWVGNILPFGTAAYVLKACGLIKEYIVSVHGLDINLAFQNKPQLALKILKNAYQITANSVFTKELATGRGIEENKITVIYPGIDSMGAAGQNRPRAKEKMVLLTVSRLVQRKGIERVIRALPMVWEQYPRLEYWIVGNGPEREHLERLVQEVDSSHPGEHRIRLWGELSGGELEKIYKEADIFIMTPQQNGPDVEGFGIVYLEASRYGLPIIASPTGGVPEAVQDGVTGLLVASDESEIARAVIRLCESPDERRALSAGGLAWAKKMDWSNQQAIFASLLE